MNLLYINAGVRPTDVARTETLANAFIAAYAGSEKDTAITQVNLRDLDLKPLDYDRLKKRDQLIEDKKWDDPEFALARQFAAADRIVIAAPFWDLSFPALLKLYIENISINGILFEYGPEGMPTGLCKAERLILIGSAGGYVAVTDPDVPYGIGSLYIRKLCDMYGIKKYWVNYAQGLDIAGNDPDKLMKLAIGDLTVLGSVWNQAQVDEDVQ